MPYVFVKNGGRTVEVGGVATRTPNCLYDPWSLLGWEIRSRSTKLIGPKGKSTMGFVCDEAGVTVAFTRKVVPSAEVCPGDATMKEMVNAPLQTFMNAAEEVEWRLKATKVPVLYLKDNGETLEWGGYIRMREKILTNGPGQPLFRIMSGQTEIVNTTTGKTEMGYICDESGQTIEIIRDIKILEPDPLPGEERKPLPAKGAELPEPDKVNVIISFCGAVGKVCSFDRIPDIFDVGQSKRNFWMGLGLGLFVMFVIRLLF